MPRCTSCGHDSPDHYQFCLNCGTKLGRPAAPDVPSSQTPSVPDRLPAIMCQHCGTENAAGMHYCSHCGRAIGPPTIAAGGNGAALASAPTPVARSPRPTPPAGVRPVIDGSRTVQSPPDAVRGHPPAAVDDRICPNCNGRTPLGYRFCQRCGKPLDETSGSITTSAGAHGQVAAVARQIRESSRESSAPQPAPPADSGAALRSPRWGTMVCVNRDGTQGAEYPLAGEYVDIGSEAQIKFADPFLAPRHLRLERPGKSASLWVTPLDRTNGVFVRIEDQVPLADRAVLLLGRELLRFELLDASEREVTQATQHGVRIFGSPVRDAWGRLSQLLPNACVRDVRHLIGVEVIIGREEGDVVFADDEFLSRRHASLHWRDGRAYLQDLGSSNGSFVRATERVELSSGTQLRFGDQVVRIDL